MPDHPLRDHSAIVGIGSTGFSRNIGRSEQETVIEAIGKACADAGIRANEIDAIFRVEGDPNVEPDLARSLGIKNLRAWASAWGGGGAACAPIVHAAMAVATGMSNYALAIRARNRSSGGRPWAKAGKAPRMTGARAFEFPYGVFSPVSWIALSARSYMHRYGAKPEHFAKVAVIQRDNAVHNPEAMQRKPITVEDVLNSRMVADPLHLLECCPEHDAAMAVIVTTPERARALRQPPALIAGVAQGSNGRSELHMSGLYSKDPHDFAGRYAREDLWRMAGISGPKDIDAAALYDMFSPVVLFSLETWGLCKQGEAWQFVESGGTTWDGPLPVNTHGGSLSEGYLHGFNHVVEAVRLIRGTSSRQPKKSINHVLATAAPIAPVSAFVLRKDQR